MLAACPKPSTTSGTPQPPVTEAPPHADQQPVVVGAANLRLHCDLKPGTTRPNPCDAPAHHMHIVGDSKSCFRRASEPNVWKLEIVTTGQTQDQIMVTVDNFNGPGTYNLDEPLKRFVKVSDTVSMPTCVGNSLSGPPTDSGQTASSPGADQWCNSSGCTMTLSSPDPNAPNRYDIEVSCPELCESNTNLVCKPSSGPVRIAVTADCPVSN